MKKFFMIAVMAVAALSANAQVWIGGNLNYETSKATAEIAGVSTDASGSKVEIAPEIGYNISDSWAVAVALGYGYSNKLTIGEGSHSVTGAGNYFTINPYARYTFVKAGNFSAFVDGGVEFTTTHINGMSDTMDNYKTFGVNVKPGIAYSISPKVTLVAHVGNVGYEYGWTKFKSTPELKISSNSFVFNLTNSVSFGAYVNL